MRTTISISELCNLGVLWTSKSISYEVYIIHRTIEYLVFCYNDNPQQRFIRDTYITLLPDE